MNKEHLRIDLDGVEMKDANGRVVCLVRWRTTRGITVRLPESVDVDVPWSLISDATLDLATGKVRLGFKPEARRDLPWLESWTSLSGEWTDRHLLENPR
jgi:hypothetical protein